MATTDIRTGYRGAQRAVGVFLPFLVAAGLAALGDRITTATSVLVLVLVVVGVGAAGDRVASVLAAVSSGLWFDFFLTEPTGQFAINDPDDVEVVVLLVAVGVAVTEIALWGLRQQARAARRAGFLDGVLESADLAAGGDVAPDEAHARVADRIAEVLEVDRCRFEPGRCHPRPPSRPSTATGASTGTASRSTSPARGCRRTSRPTWRPRPATVTSGSPRRPGSPARPGSSDEWRCSWPTSWPGAAPGPTRSDLRR